MNAINNLKLLVSSLVIIGFIACSNTAFSQKKSEKLQLTKHEKAWLNAHPNITLGYTADLEPDVIPNADGTYSGMVVDFLSLLNQKLGTNINLSINRIPEVLDNAQKKNIDGVLNIHPEYSDSLGLASTNAYWPAYLAVFAPKGVSFDKLEDFTDKRVAVIKGVYITQKYIEKLKSKINIIEVDNVLEGLQQVQKGEVDYFFGLSTNSFFIPKYQLLDVVPTHVFTNKPEWFGIGLRDDYPELLSILNKGIALISEQEIYSIISKWSYLPKQVESTELSKAEKAWISQNHVVDVRITEFPPYAILTERGPSGVVIDFLNKVSAQTGVQFNFKVSNQSYKTDVDDLKNLKGFDLIPGMMFSEEEQWSVSFSQPIYNSPIVIFTRTDAEFISTIKDLPGKKVAATNGSLIIPTIRDQYPEVNMHACKNGSEGILMLAEGKVDAFVGNLTATSYFIQKYGITNVRVAAPSLLPMQEYGFGGRKDWPELTSIIDKVWAEVSEEEKSAMLGKYLSVQYEHGIRKEDVLKWGWIIGLPLLIILITFLTWNRMLNKRVRKAVSEVKDSELRFRTTFEQSAVGVGLVGTDLSFLRINQKYCDIVGYSHEELIALTFQDITYPEDLDIDMEYVRELQAGKKNTYTMEKRYVCKDASIVWVNLTVAAVRKENGEVDWYICFIEDVTQRKQAEMALQESEERFRATFEQAAVGVAHVSPEGSFLRVNQKFSDIVGYTQQEMLEVTFQDITHPDDLELDLEKVNKLLDGELETYSMEKRYFHKNGSIVWINLTVSLLRTSAGEPDYFIAVIEEITAKIEAENRVKESEEKFRSLMEQSPLSIQICDKNGLVLDGNKAWRQLWNISEEDMPYVKANYNFLKDEEVKKRGILPLIEKAFTGETVQLPDLFYESAGVMDAIGLAKEKATAVWLRITLYPILDEAGDVKNVISIEEDITESKLAEDKLKQSEKYFRDLVEQNPLFIEIYNPEGQLIHLNNAYKNLLAIDEDLSQMLYSHYNLLEDEYAIENGLGPGIKNVFGGEYFDFHEYEFDIDLVRSWLNLENKNWGKIWCKTTGFPIKDEHGAIKQVVFLSQDVSSRVTAEQGLIENENKFRALFNRGGYAMGLSKMSDRRATMVNQAWLALYGYSSEIEVVGSLVTDFIVPEERKDIKEIARQRLTDDAPLYYITKGLRKDNSSFDVEMRITTFEMEGEKYTLAMMTDITEQKLNEKQILGYQARLKALTVELTLAEEKQNKKIATDLHDQVGQLLASSRFQIADLDSSMAKSEILAKNKVISKGLLLAIQATRNAIFNLSPPQLNEIGLFAAISDWLDLEIEAKHNLETRLTGDDIIYNMNEDLRFLLFRCTRELVFNVVKHAHASYVLTSIKKNKKNIEIKVIDDGLGFNYDPAMFKINNIGYGLFSIQERIENYGGIIKIDSALGKGTEIELIVPLKKEI